MPLSHIPLWSLIPFGAALIHGFFWMYVFAFHRDNALARTFLIFEASLIALCAAEFALVCAPDHASAFLWMRVTGAAAPITTVLLFNFARRLTEYSDPLPLVVFTVPLAVFILLTLVTDRVISDVMVIAEGKSPVPGPLSIPMAVLALALISLICAYFVMYLVRGRDPVVRKQIRIILIGIAPAFLVSVLFNVIVPYFFFRRTIPNIISIPSIIITAFIFIAVVRYRVFSDLLPKAAREMFLQITDGVILCDREDRIAAMNKNAAVLLDVAVGEARMPIRSILDGRLCDTGPSGAEMTIGEKTFIVSKSPLTHGGIGIGMLITLSDISARKNAETALARTNAELSLFASAVSHDLREPLRGISSFIDLLRHRANDRLTDAERGFIDNAVRSAVRLNRMISDLLVFLRTGSTVDPVPVDMNAVFKDARSQNELRAREAGVSIQAEPLPSVRGNHHLLVMVLQNLIDNAIKFRGAHEPFVHISAQRRGTFSEFSVIDNGIGFNAEHSERIFVLFRRLHTESDRPGTGLGLALCKKIIEAHGGSIRAESRPAGGATFYFTVPAM